MILVKDLIQYIKQDIFIMIDLGADDNNICRICPYRSKEHNDLTIKEISIIDENHISFKVL